MDRSLELRNTFRLRRRVAVIERPLPFGRRTYLGVLTAGSEEVRQRLLDMARLARLEDAPIPPEMAAAMFEMPEDSPMLKVGPAECTTAAYGNRADILNANIPAGGTVTARAVARMYAALLGDVKGVRLISPERLREVSAMAMSGTDQIFGFPKAWGLGYSIGQFMSNTEETRHVFGAGGVGGSHAYADTATGTTFALTKNRLAPSFDTAEQVAGIVTEAVAAG